MLIVAVAGLIVAILNYRDKKQPPLSLRESDGYFNVQIVTRKPKRLGCVQLSVLLLSILYPICSNIAIKNLRPPLYGRQLIETATISDPDKTERKDNRPGGNFLFIQRNGTQMYPSTPYGVFKDILHRYNAIHKEKLPDIPLHGLRYTSATLLISQNIDIRTVSNLLGHAQTSTTMNIYSHSLQQLDSKAAETLENLLVKKAKCQSKRKSTPFLGVLLFL